MSTSARIEALTQRYRSSQYLTAPHLSPVAVGPGDLAVDQPAAALDARVVDEVAAGLRAGNTHYVDVPGMASVREALLAEITRLGAKGFEQATTMVTSSVQEGRFLAMQTITGHGGAIAVPAVMHPGARAVLGIRPLDVRVIEAEASTGFLASPAAIDAALTAGARVVYLESPSRLSGAAYGADEVAAIAASVEAADAHLIVDQGLAPWVDGFVSFGSRDELTGRLTIVGEALPGRGLEGFGIGFLATSVDHIGAITKLKQVMSICTSTPSQLAVQSASADAAAKCDDMRAALARARAEAVDAAGRQGYQVVAGISSAVIALRHPQLSSRTASLAAAGVHVASGADFGAADVIRVSVSGDGRTAEALAQSA